MWLRQVASYSKLGFLGYSSTRSLRHWLCHRLSTTCALVQVMQTSHTSVFVCFTEAMLYPITSPPFRAFWILCFATPWQLGNILDEPLLAQVEMEHLVNHPPVRRSTTDLQFQYYVRQPNQTSACAAAQLDHTPVLFTATTLCSLLGWSGQPHHQLAPAAQPPLPS